MSQKALKENDVQIIQEIIYSGRAYRLDKRNGSKIEYLLLTRPLTCEEKEAVLKCDFGSRAFAEKRLRKALVWSGHPLDYMQIKKVLDFSKRDSKRGGNPFIAINNINSFFRKHDLLVAVYPEGYEPKKISHKDWSKQKFRIYIMEKIQ